jgi:hypothetical protein
MTFVHPISVSFPPDSRLRSKGPSASRVFSTLLVVHCWCSTGTGSTRRIRSVLCLPMQPLRAIILATWVMRAQMYHLAATSGTQHAQCDGAVLLARHAGAHSAMPRAGSSSEDQGQLEGGQAETAADGQGQMRTDHLEEMKWQRVPDRQADRLCQSRVFQAGCVPGATEGSMPVGSGSIIYASF